MKDYKLSEIKKICEKYSTDYDRFCEKCPLRNNNVCRELEGAPATWEIDEKEYKETVVALTREECEHKVILDDDHFLRALDNERAQARKETAKEILNRINEYNLDYNWDLKEEFKKLCKDYDVEVEDD